MLPISLTIFFPTYNEEENIERTVEEAVRIAESSPYIDAYEILIINDGSSDGTEEIAEELARRYRAVRVLNHPKNRGYGAALKTGLKNAQMEYVFFTDADLQFDIAELQNLLIHAPKYDAVIGYRAPRRDPLMRLLNAWGWNKLNRLLFGLKIRDIDCAFKLFRRSAIENIDLHSRGAMLSAELLIRLTRRDARVKEVPVSHLPRIAGSPTGAKPSVILRAFEEMIALFMGDLGGASQKQALKYITVGVINTLLDAVAYIALTRGTVVFSEHLVAAKFFSFLVGTVSSLTLNRWWTFRIRQRLTFGEVVRFYAMMSLSIVVNVEGMNLLVAAGMYDLLALAITTIGTFGVSFTLSKFWVFLGSPSASANLTTVAVTIAVKIADMKKHIALSFMCLFLLTLSGASAARASAHTSVLSPFAPQGLDPAIASDTPFVPVMPSIPTTAVTANVYDVSDSFDPGTTRILLALAVALMIIGGVILEERALKKILARFLPRYYSDTDESYAHERRRYAQSPSEGISVDPTLGQVQQTI